MEEVVDRETWRRQPGGVEDERADVTGAVGLDDVLLCRLCLECPAVGYDGEESEEERQPHIPVCRVGDPDFVCSHAVNDDYERDEGEEYQTDSEDTKKFWSHDGISGLRMMCEGESGKSGCCCKVLREGKRRSGEGEKRKRGEHG